MLKRSGHSILFWINVILVIILIALATFVVWKKYLKPISIKRNTLISTQTPLTNKADSNLNATNLNNDSADTTSTNQVASNNTYTNTKYGYSLVLNPLWKGYTVTEDSGTGFVDSFNFQLPTTDKSWPQAVASQFVVTIFTPDQWQTIQSQTGPKPTLITQNAQYVFAYSSAQAEPSDLLGRLSEVADIISTFKLSQ
jgi:hypothetical protein